MTSGGSRAENLISCLFPGGSFKTERGVESGSGIISSLQGIGSGSSRSLTPLKTYSATLPRLYFTKHPKSVQFGGEREQTYQTACKDLELILNFEILLLENTYKTGSNLEKKARFPNSLLKVLILSNPAALIEWIVAKVSIISRSERTCFRARLIFSRSLFKAR